MTLKTIQHPNLTLNWEIHTRKVQDIEIRVCELFLKGRIDSSSLGVIKDFIENLYRNEILFIALNLSEVDYIMSSCWKSLALYRKGLKKKQGELVLTSLNDVLEDSLTMSKYRKYFITTNQNKQWDLLFASFLSSSEVSLFHEQEEDEITIQPKRKSESDFDPKTAAFIEGIELSEMPEIEISGGQKNKPEIEIKHQIDEPGKIKNKSIAANDEINISSPVQKKRKLDLEIDLQDTIVPKENETQYSEVIPASIDELDADIETDLTEIEDFLKTDIKEVSADSAAFNTQDVEPVEMDIEDFQDRPEETVIEETIAAAPVPEDEEQDIELDIESQFEVEEDAPVSDDKIAVPYVPETTSSSTEETTENGVPEFEMDIEIPVIENDGSENKSDTTDSNDEDIAPEFEMDDDMLDSLHDQPQQEECDEEQPQDDTTTLDTEDSPAPEIELDPDDLMAKDKNLDDDLEEEPSEFDIPVEETSFGDEVHSLTAIEEENDGADVEENDENTSTVDDDDEEEEEESFLEDGEEEEDENEDEDEDEVIASYLNEDDDLESNIPQPMTDLPEICFSIIYTGMALTASLAFYFFFPLPDEKKVTFLTNFGIFIFAVPLLIYFIFILAGRAKEKNFQGI